MAAIGTWRRRNATEVRLEGLKPGVLGMNTASQEGALFVSTLVASASFGSIDPMRPARFARQDDLSGPSRAKRLLTGDLGEENGRWRRRPRRQWRVVTWAQEALIRRPFKELQEELDPACFWPIHRSTIVNADAIAGVARDLRGRILVKLKARTEKLAVSEAHEHLFKQM